MAPSSNDLVAAYKLDPAGDWHDGSQAHRVLAMALNWPGEEPLLMKKRGEHLDGLGGSSLELLGCSCSIPVVFLGFVDTMGRKPTGLRRATTTATIRFCSALAPLKRF